MIEQDREQAPSWQVLLLGGASGVGKSSVSYRLAQHYGAGLTEVDDFQIILERMTSDDQYPDLHYWRRHNDEALLMDDEQMLAFSIRYARVMAIALESVIANHIETRMPIVLEGDFILPELAVLPKYNAIAADGHVRALLVYEEDEQQIARNYGLREGDEQRRRSRASWRYSEWLRTEADRLGLPAISSRPWDTVLERAIAAIDGSHRSG